MSHVTNQQLRRARRVEHRIRHRRNRPAGSWRRWARSSARRCRSQAQRRSRSRSTRTCGHAFALHGERRSAERGKHGLDGQLRNGIGRDDLAAAARRSRARPSASPARTGQAVGLRQGAQHDEVRESRELRRERSVCPRIRRRPHRPPPVRWPQCDQQLLAWPRAIHGIAGRIVRGAQEHDLRVGIARREHAAASSAKPLSRLNGTSRTSAPWMRAATAYMPKVGGQMTTHRRPRGRSRAPAGRWPHRCRGRAAAASLHAVERRETLRQHVRMRFRITIEPRYASDQCRRATATRWRAAARAPVPSSRAE